MGTWRPFEIGSSPESPKGSGSCTFSFRLLNPAGCSTLVRGQPGPSVKQQSWWRSTPGQGRCLGGPSATYGQDCLQGEVLQGIFGLHGQVPFMCSCTVAGGGGEGEDSLDHMLGGDHGAFQWLQSCHKEANLHCQLRWQGGGGVQLDGRLCQVTPCRVISAVEPDNSQRLHGKLVGDKHVSSTWNFSRTRQLMCMLYNCPHIWQPVHHLLLINFNP